ncbi:hypothetical protein ACIPUB_09920 [Paeniglutamicibacter sp. ORCA_105]|uniref:hypothetical protein n=1 Tax=Paeniglutamicibacter sp. ORCA_105 TaxID=3377336 RepID=UPI003895C75C
MTKPRTPDAQYAHDFKRFSKFVVPGGTFGNCWIFTGSTRDGYGQFRDGRRMLQAHRFAYRTVAGLDLSAHLDLDHRCYETLCVRPSHTRKVGRSQHLKDTWHDARTKVQAEAERGEALGWNAGNPKPLSIKELNFGIVNRLPVNLFGADVDHSNISIDD